MFERRDLQINQTEQIGIATEQRLFSYWLDKSAHNSILT